MLSHRLRLSSRWLRLPGRTVEESRADRRDEPSGADAEARPCARLRPATLADLDALGRLGSLLMRTHHEFDPRRFIPAPPGIEREYASFFSGQMADPDVVILVAEHDGEVLGYSYAVINWSFLQLRSKKEVNEHLAKRRAA